MKAGIIVQSDSSVFMELRIELLIWTVTNSFIRVTRRYAQRILRIKFLMKTPKTLLPHLYLIGGLG